MSELQYLATILDYNESIRLLHRNGSCYPVISIAVKSKAIADRLQRLMLVRPNQTTAGYSFICTHSRAIATVRKIYKYLIESRTAADEVLAWRPPVRPPRQNPKVPCSKGCGGMMSERASQCINCRIKADRAAFLAMPRPSAEIRT